MIKDLLVDLGAIKFGDFTLTSGKKSTYYVDMKSAFAGSPALLKELTEEISRRLTAGKVAGVELGAVPLVVAAAFARSTPFIIIRKEGREHGLKDPVIGAIASGEEVEIIEDVVTTGGSVLRAVNLLRSRGAVVKKVICVVDREDGGTALLRENGIELVPLVRISELLKK
ncbi:MAG: orotate phosphoribosyltransferase [Candidatus Marsarchaeota archaeon]|jgi:orotate phosphoribosyltransferase|nr:orotate phosphoribosyltransferase [Candidatus Marsarchaeota archaeon]